MINSMTGYACATRDLATLSLNVELRSVNHRYLDVQFRLPDELRPLEAVMRDTILSRVQRGKLECRIGIGPLRGAARAELNNDALRQLRELSEKLRLAWPSVPGLTASDILHWPGVLATEALSPEAVRGACVEALAETLEEFNASRAREGEKLSAVLLDRIATMRERVTTVLPRMPQILAAYEEKLRVRLREVLAGDDGERIQQEVALLATRIDIDEELSRLNAHFTEVERILAVGGAVGKRLDFLMQELNREANTLGSKAADFGITQVSLDLKLLIEQMREQIQNIE